MNWAKQSYDTRMAAMERWLESRPVCDRCGEHIQDEYGYKVDGETLCPDCFIKWADDLRFEIE